MRALCWNLGFAAGQWRENAALHDRAWHWIAAVDPDVVFAKFAAMAEGARIASRQFWV